MGGGGEKRREKLLSEFRGKLLVTVSVVNALFFLIRYFVAWESFTTGRQYGYYANLGVTILFAFLLLRARSNSRLLDLQKDGDAQPGSTYIDILALAFFIQLFSIYSDYMFYFYLVIPFAVIYKAGKRLVTWVFTPQESDFIDDETTKGRRPPRERKLGNKHARFRG